jgi:SAM-dependent methyltransferase
VSPDRYAASRGEGPFPAGDPVAVRFEFLYAGAGDDPAAVPWAIFAPRPALVEWLDTRPPPRHGSTALVVACGYGDDAEELARRGWAVRAFDVAPTAIAQCRRRFPRSPVDYRVADLLDLPGDWPAYDLVVEVQTIQSLPLSCRGAATAAIAATVGAGGTLFLRAYGRDDGDPVRDPPWPVSRADLARLADNGLTEIWFEDEHDPDGVRTFHAAYSRPSR